MSTSTRSVALGWVLGIGFRWGCLALGEAIRIKIRDAFCPGASFQAWVCVSNWGYRRKPERYDGIREVPAIGCIAAVPYSLNCLEQGF